MKCFSDSCERNQDPILSVLRDVFSDRKHVLEIGSGTGQHAVYFGRHLPYLIWQTSELKENHSSIQAWINEAELSNVRSPILIDAGHPDWPVKNFDTVFSANAVHIMSWPEVERLFQGISRVLDSQGLLCLYGPFNFGGKFSSESNARFDRWLKDRNPMSGVRDFEALDRLAGQQGLIFVKNVSMPSNNHCLIWTRKA